MERYNFCTLFNSCYAARGLVMYESLERCARNFHLYIFAFDDILLKALQEMNLKNATIISLKEFEDERLLKIKAERTSREYCWTCESVTIQYCLNNYDIDNCTYIDADLRFYSDPSVLVDEMGDNDVLLTEHRYARDTYYGGRFCVQFTTFKNTENGRKILDWWVDRCMEWCGENEEDGKFGDQMYLEDWTERFKGVHVLQHLGGGIAPWNAIDYDFYKDGDKIVGRKIKTGETFDMVFYHFHNTRISYIHISHLHFLVKKLFSIIEFRPRGYELPQSVFNISREYYSELVSASKKFDHNTNPLCITSFVVHTLKDFIKHLMHGYEFLSYIVLVR